MNRPIVLFLNVNDETQRCSVIQQLASSSRDIAKGQVEIPRGALLMALAKMQLKSMLAAEELYIKKELLRAERPIDQFKIQDRLCFYTATLKTSSSVTSRVKMIT